LAAKIGLLVPAYFVQGLPFGFQAHALQLYLIDAGVRLEGVGFAGVLALPWMLKVLWAPFVDSWYSARFGRRKSWIVPMQAAIASTCLGLAMLPPTVEGLPVILAAIFGMNLFAATMDIAVDGLAVSMLDERELGIGNVGQVVGYKLGMVVGGNLLLPVAESHGWPMVFMVMGLCVVPPLAFTLWMREGDVVRGERLGDGDAARPGELRRILAALRRSLQEPGAGWFLAIVATYKLGESVGDAMFRPWLYLHGYDKSQLGLAVGLSAAIASMVGSGIGGVLAHWWPGLRGVAIAAVLRVVPLAALAGVALRGGPPALDVAVGLAVAESVFGGALTVTMFAAMMRRVDPEIGGTHYTALATVEVLGKSPGALLSGVLAVQIGFGGAFVVAALLSLAFLGLVPFARDPKPNSDRRSVSPVDDATSR